MTKNNNAITGFRGKSADIARLLMLGMRPTEVAKALDCSLPEVSRVKNSQKYNSAKRKAALSLLYSEGVLIGVETLIEIASDKKASSGARVSAAGRLLDFAGISEEKRGDKTASEMTHEELMKEYEAIRAEAAKRAEGAKLIEHDDQGNLTIDNLL